MIITWYGLSCFKIETRDAVLCLSPFSKAEDLGIAKSPRFKANIVLVSQNTPQYNGVSGIEQGYARIDEPGEYEIADVFVSGIASNGAKVNAKDGAENTLFVIRAEDMTLGYLGGLGEGKLAEEALHKLEGVDVLLVPTGGAGVCSPSYAATLVSHLEPTVVIPMHYKVTGMKGRMEGIDAFRKEINIKAEELDRLSIRQRDLADAETRLVVLTPQAFAKI